MTIKQARVDAGVPAGGQFTTMQRDEADLNLDLDALADAYLDAHESDRTDVDLAVSRAYDSARHWEARKGVRDRSRGVVDVDDIAQEALLAVLEREANGHVIEDSKAYMHTYAWGIAQQAGNVAVRQENRKALKIFRDRCNDRTATLGRRLTPREEDEIAEDIRATWFDPRRRPSKDFRSYAGQMEVSMDAQESSDAAGYLLPNSTIGRPGEDAAEVLPGSYTDRALAAAEGHDGDLRDAKRLAWNAFAEVAEDHEVPMVEPGTLSQRRVTDARAKVPNVLAAVDAWERGRDDETTSALFAPWGGEEADRATRAAVITQLKRFPDQADLLWGSALQLANNRNADRS